MAEGQLVTDPERPDRHQMEVPTAGGL